MTIRTILAIGIASTVLLSEPGIALEPQTGPEDEEAKVAQLPQPPTRANPPSLPGQPPRAPVPSTPTPSPPASTPPPTTPSNVSAPSTAVALPPVGGATASPAAPVLSSLTSGAEPDMIGDMSPILSLRSLRGSALPPTPPPLPSPGKASSFVASVRGLKISENQSPRPQDRFFYTFNFFAEVNQHLNQKLEASVAGLRVYREVLGFEKTFHNGDGSFGLRMPIDTVSANSTVKGNFAKLAGTSTAVGDLSFFGKYVFLRDPATGSLLTGGLAISTPNGPGQFAGAKYLANLHSTSIQPFIGYIWRRDRFYLHGFSAIDTPSTLRQPTLIYNDVGIGYFVLRRPDPDYWLTAVAPTFEVHVNTPLTHGDPYNRLDPGGVPNVVNLTYGINLEFSHSSVLTFGMATPVTGPRPFDYEAIILFNVFFGRTRRTMQGNPPMIGG